MSFFVVLVPFLIVVAAAAFLVPFGIALAIGRGRGRQEALDYLRVQQSREIQR
ncbi:MAG TPA: hypothetical protein PKV13_11860 [Propionicimonas sp.]|nr:hypothetical protein [Propionicimonas sp.]HRA07296.1 hypothetical protein [Propionicimonas sp.]